MRSEARRSLNCAIYTRKSTDHNLELEFNSLDAQRDAAEAFIKSQANEGWRALPDRYDDGAVSGGTLDRPALQQLIEAVRAGKVNVVVVYKIDRLTRSLSDFAKLVEIFDAHGVSFVSVTQQFNTTSSMGRLTLNVLLSFAQFEREVIGERVRDKISASKRKGIWVGGPVPMGYVVKGKKPVIVDAEAERVRFIFRRYLELGCLSALQGDLAARGFVSKVRRLPSGVMGGGKPFSRGALAHLLKNRFYIGEVRYRGEIYPGEQEALIERSLFEAAQAKLEANAVARKHARLRTGALLAGRLFDDRGNRMSPGHANKKGVRYRYYVSQAVLQGRKERAGSVARAPAPDLEALVVTALREQLSPLPAQLPSAAPRTEPFICNAGEPSPCLDVPDGTAAIELVERVVIRHNAVEITVKRNTLANGPKHQDGEVDRNYVGPDEGEQSVISVAWSPRRNMTAVTNDSGQAQTISPQARSEMLRAIARCTRWVDELARGDVRDFVDLANREGMSERYIRAQLPLAFLAPSIVVEIAGGELPTDVRLTNLWNGLGLRWKDQEKSVLGNP
jgi:DNA invertase Pin-like site-specific DNA recombinase